MAKNLVGMSGNKFLQPSILRSYLILMGGAGSNMWQAKVDFRDGKNIVNIWDS